MIVSKTPFRISFAGGGTDLRSFYSREAGQVLSTSIDKYIWVTVKRQIGIVERRYKINWSRQEFVDRIEDIEHPIVREALKLMEIDFAIEISIYADIPAGTGVGSSSTFTVGLLHTLFALQGRMASKESLASMAANIEVNILKRPMGAQDHYAAAYGDLNVITFHRDDTVSVDPVLYDVEVRRELERRLLLFYTSIKRDSSEVLRRQDAKTPDKFDTLRQMRDLVGPLREVISGGADLAGFGRILHQGWTLKRSITGEISSPEIDSLYQRGLDAGAIGGKLLGAGGGGFLLFYAEPEYHAALTAELADLFPLPFAFDGEGTRITYYDPPTF